MISESNKDKLYKKYYKLIYKAIKDLNCYYTNDDEYQEHFENGQIGLLNAINNYNNNKEETSTYFYTCIKNSIKQNFTFKSAIKRRIDYLEKDSLDEEMVEDNNLYNVIPDESVNIENDIIKQEEYEILYKAINMLKPTYKDIICRLYGIKCERENIESLSKKYKISRQAISVKRDNALIKLKEYITKLGDDKNDL